MHINRSQANASNSHLLRLPAELRNHVYDYVFEHTTLVIVMDISSKQGTFENSGVTTANAHLSTPVRFIEMAGPVSKDSRSAVRVINFLALASVCRKVYVETFELPSTRPTLDCRCIVRSSVSEHGIQIVDLP
jgi:hypothetical protein